MDHGVLRSSAAITSYLTVGVLPDPVTTPNSEFQSHIVQPIAED